MDARDELERLLADLLDGPPNSERNDKLAALLRAHPELQQEYLDHLQLHALLQWRSGHAGPREHAPLEPKQPETIPVSLTHAGSSPWRSSKRLAVALTLLAAGVAVFLIAQIPQAAPPDLVERLIDWNLDLTQARLRDERDRIYGGQAAELQATLAKAALPLADRQLVETLLENSSWLAKNTDPMAEADRFNDIADLLVTQLDGAAATQDEHRIVKLANRYQRVTELGVDANLDRARASADVDQEKKQILDRTTQRHATRHHRLVEIMDQKPEVSRKAFRRGMKGHVHKGKKTQKSNE